MIKVNLQNQLKRGKVARYLRPVIFFGQIMWRMSVMLLSVVLLNQHVTPETIHMDFRSFLGNYVPKLAMTTCDKSEPKYPMYL